ncbi:hypothetical protein [Micromonospora sp. NPDC005254]|uniref:hypothetical protein n=1 Tax=Micromonospora sp. NPDC005254 TaxID=3364229 RepID=UPI0036A2B16D
MLIGAACSVQFTGERALLLRLVSLGEVDPYTGWLWITDYALDAQGLARAKRELFVRRAGLRVQRRVEPAVGRSRRSSPRLTT